MLSRRRKAELGAEVDDELVETPFLIDHAAEFRERLIDWYDQNARELPWRSQPSLYKTVVSEFMLQHRMGGGSGIDGLFEAYASNASNLRELRRRGQRHLFIGGMTDCDHCAGPQTPTPGCNATQMPPDESCCDAQGC